jgi:hypothetical protein
MVPRDGNADPQDVRRSIEVNLMGTVWTSRAAWKFAYVAAKAGVFVVRDVQIKRGDRDALACALSAIGASCSRVRP